MKLFIVVFSCLLALGTALYSPSDDVIELTESNFNTRVLQSSELWFVEFYAPWCGHCKSLAPEWKKAATALKGIVNVGAVDMTAHQSVGAPYNVQGFPTIKIFGANKQKPQDYQGARSAQAIVDSAMSQLRTLVNDRLSGKTSGGGSGDRASGKKTAGDEKDVIELTDSNFEELVLKSDDMWLVEFFAPWCGHCKNLAPHWASAATQLKGKVKLGALDATVHTVMSNRYGVRGFPTIKYFPAGKKEAGDAEEFNGGRTSDDIVAWALEKLAENVPAPDVLELTDESVLKRACEDHQLCLVSILPQIYDCQSNCRNSYLGLLRRLGEKHKKRMWGWVWAEAGAQSDVEEALNIGGFGYPAMAAVNTRKMKFSLLKGSFSEKGLNEFLLEVAVGRSSTEPIKAGQLPKVTSIEAWDGKDAELPPEEDIDLDDVFDDVDNKKTEL
jgi:protein disulfide-isomerase A6